MDSTDQDSAAAPAPTPVPVVTTKAKTSPFSLTVKFAFADYQVGQSITDPAEVAAVLAGECAANVLKTSA
jgi:hypothetical protein